MTAESAVGPQWRAGIVQWPLIVLLIQRRFKHSGREITDRWLGAVTTPQGKVCTHLFGRSDNFTHRDSRCLAIHQAKKGEDKKARRENKLHGVRPNNGS